jgi:hypothetical protein
MASLEQIELLQHIKNSDSPTWDFLSQNYPPGEVWTPTYVAKLLSELETAKMVSEDQNRNYRLLAAGQTILDYYSDKEKENSLQIEKLKLEVEKLRNEYFDYPKTKKRAKDAILISILTILAATLLGVLQIVCNK